MTNKFSNKEFWFWVYWMRIKEIGLIKLCTENIELKKLGVRRLFYN